MNFNREKDWNYYWIVKKGNRSKMYKYKLIRSIIEDLDKYLEENEIDIIEDENELLRMINWSCHKHSEVLIKYFSVFSPPGFYKDISISDIEDWTRIYKKKNKLYYENENWIYGQ